MVECGGLENRWASRSRGFESLPLRQFPDSQYIDGLLAAADQAVALACRDELVA